MIIRVLALRLAPVLVAIAASAAALLSLSGTGDAVAGSERLPDLEPAPPSGLILTRAGATEQPSWFLGFRSAVGNVGRGPLIIEGHRAGPGDAAMSADQLVDGSGGGQRVIHDAGELRFVVSPDHRHWHLLGFVRYELRAAGHTRPVVRDRKSGFCLGDRYAVPGPRLAAAPPAPVHRSRCGLGEPGLLGIREGISVGYGDDYAANLEGQYLALSGLPAGRYVLVHRVDVERRLRELDVSNNASSLLLDLRWNRRHPSVRILASCPRTDRCVRRAPR